MIQEDYACFLIKDSVILSYLKKDLFNWQYLSATMKDEKRSDFAKHPKTKMLLFHLMFILHNSSIVSKFWKDFSINLTPNLLVYDRLYFSRDQNINICSPGLLFNRIGKVKEKKILLAEDLLCSQNFCICHPIESSSN